MASTRLNQLALGITYGPCSASQLALTDGDPNQNATLMNVQSDSNAMEASEETREVILESKFIFITSAFEFFHLDY